MVPMEPPPARKVAALARAWTQSHPRLASRIARAVALVAQVRPSRDLKTWTVEGSKGATYTVTVEGGKSTCTCVDHSQGNHCKHRLAAALYFAAHGCKR